MVDEGNDGKYCVILDISKEYARLEGGSEAGGSGAYENEHPMIVTGETRMMI